MTHPIFISYRRLDSEAEAGRLLTTLQHEWGDDFVFMDTVSILPGVEWPESIQLALTEAATVIVIIGPHWLSAGSDDWGQRPIDKPQDWVRKEVQYALENRKRIIPVLVREATIPPAEVLPDRIKKLVALQAIEIRGQYWEHDVKLLLRQLEYTDGAREDEESQFYPFPVPPEGDVELVTAFSDKQLDLALGGPLKAWRKVESELPEDKSRKRVELFREFKFESFQDAIGYMSQVAKGCDIANHHPRWENIWKTLRVYMSTWNIGHRISDRDVQLAKYFDSAYADFIRSARKK